MICPLHKARGWVQCPAWAKSKGRSGRQCAMPGNADLLDCQGQPQPPPLRSGKHTTIAQQESGRILSSIWRQVVGAIPTGGPRQLRRMFADCADKLAYGGLFDGWKDSPGPAGYPAPIPPPAPLYDVSQGGHNSGDPWPKQENENKKTAPGTIRELFWYQGLSVMCNVDFSAACRTAEKLTPAFSASKLSQEGIVQFFLTARISFLRRYSTKSTSTSVTMPSG